MIGERALRQLDEVLSHSPLALVAVDGDFRVSYWSRRAEELLGYTSEELLGRHPRELSFIHPDDLASVLHLEDRVDREPLASLSLVNRVNRKDGSTRTFHWTTVAVQDDTTYHVVFVGEDITANVRTQAALGQREQELAESEARLRSLFEHNPDAVLALDLEGTMTACNDAAVRVSGMTRERIVGQKYAANLPRSVRPDVEAAFAQAAGGIPATVSFGVINAKGRAIEVDGTIIPQYSQGRIVGIYAVFQDSTERRGAERRAQMQQQRIRDLYFIAASGDRPESRIRTSLEMGARAFGLSVAAVVDLEVDPPRIAQIYRAQRGSAVSDERVIAAARTALDLGPVGTPVVSLQGVAMRLEANATSYGVLVFASTDGMPQDFSPTDADLLGLISRLIVGAIESDRSRAQLRTLAYHDTLTGLPNRAYLSEKLRDALEVSQSRLSQAAVIYLGLDGFKDVNDTLGHARGDRLLQLVAQRLSQLTGDRGTVARMGGDEFVVLLHDCADERAARAVAEHIIGAVSEPFALDEYEQYISASAGVAMYPEDGRDDQTLIKNADVALSSAKERGRNALLFYDPKLEAPIHLRLSQEKLLRRALELDEFVLYYQPQLDLHSGRVVSLEALVRWNHPKSGIIEPSHFIPSAEISGLIVALGDWVVATAAAQVRQWEPRLGRLRLAVNLSARQFHDRELRKRITTALAEANFSPVQFEVEITESVAMADAAQTAAIVRDLTASGIRVALDDFGTGYSSLAYLSSFDLDVLKIDRSFVAGIGRSPSDETIVNTVIGMAHSLDLEVIAEGVETREQLAFLSAEGCDGIQGFVVAPAMPAPEFEEFFVAHRERNTA